ncbi:MAG: hypothetical protein U9N46_05235 [Euryarchaeota archaeon]|nr:hypothetical protein [Euryarchaeota archaeon]
MMDLLELHLKRRGEAPDRCSPVRIAVDGMPLAAVLEVTCGMLGSE